MLHIKTLAKYSLHLLATVALMISAVYVHADKLESIVDRTTISLEETLRLTVKYSGQSKNDQPSFARLSSDFDILSTSQRNSYQNINGQVSHTTQWEMVLSPLREGELTIPEFRYGSVLSEPVSIRVTKASAPPTGKLRDIFIETIVDKSSVYVQEQLLVTYRLYFSANLSGLQNEPLELDGVILEPLPDTRYERRIEGKLYGVAEFSQALFPQESGELEIPALRWIVDVRQGFGRREQRTLRTDRHVVTVKPVPDEFPVGYTWLPAQDLRLQESWTSDPERFNPGEPITRKITLEAKGLMASQLPKIWSGYDSSTIKTYADQPEMNDDKTSSGVNSQRIESAAVVLSTPGKDTLPSIRIPWWDIESDSLKWASISERIVEAQGKISSATNNNTAQSSNEQVESETMPAGSASDPVEIEQLKSQLKIWQVVAFSLLTLSVVLAALFLQLKRKRLPAESDVAGETSETQNFSRLIKLCETNAPAKDIRHALFSWAESRWQKPIATLDTIIQLTDDDQLTQQLQVLDRSMWRKEDGQSIDTGELGASLKRVRKQKTKGATDSSLKKFAPH